MSRQKSNLAYSSLEKLLSELLSAQVEFTQVGQRIREIREHELGLGQTEFARKIGKTQTDVSHYEKGERLKDQADILLRIAKLDPKKRGVWWLLGGYAALTVKERERGKEAQIREPKAGYTSAENRRWHEANERLLRIRYHQPKEVQDALLDQLSLLSRIEKLK